MYYLTATPALEVTSFKLTWAFPVIMRICTYMLLYVYAKAGYVPIHPFTNAEYGHVDSKDTSLISATTYMFRTIWEFTLSFSADSASLSGNSWKARLSAD